MPKIIWEVPMKTVSEANCSEHWRVKSKRHKIQQFLIASLFKHEAQEIPFPCCVTLIRLSPKPLDSDNLTCAFKWIRDEISECLLPDEQKTFLNAKGKPQKIKGRLDSDPRILWRYSQRKCKIQGIRIEIEELTETQKFEIAHEQGEFLCWDG